ncbi:sensor histidine kinase [Christensenellaceae bacterium OttesenSCG-928-K19]|nr:sensor histidine kinase [Christensenellaceae bacterium OttesenSCG-928-K19]
MSERRKNILAFAAFLIILFIFFQIIGNINPVPYEQVETEQNGHVDLSGFSFDYKLASVGSWEHFPEELLLPSEIGNRQGESISPDYAYGTHRLILTLPDTQPYTLQFSTPDYASRIFIEGEHIVDVGFVGPTEEESTPQTKQFVYTVSSHNGTIEIVLHYANYWGRAGSGVFLLVGTPGPMTQFDTARTFDKSFRLGILCAAFLLHFGLFLFHPKQRANLFFSLACLALFFREALVGIKLFHTLSPFTSWHFTYGLEYLSIILIFIFFMEYLRAFFPGHMHKPVHIAFLAIAIGYICLILFTPSRIYSSLLLIPQLLFLFGAIYMAIRIFRNIRQLSLDQWLALIGLIIFAAAYVNEVFYFRDMTSIAIFSTAVLVMLFSQMIALFLQFIRIHQELSQIKEKDRALSAENKALHHIDELRVQFLSNVSHELKMPLAIMSGYAQITRQHLEGDEKNKDYIGNLRLISSEAQRLALMVEQLLDVTRIEEDRMAWNMQAADISSVIGKTIDTYFPILNEHHNSLVTEIEPGLPLVEMDADRITQVLVNLITNAVRHTKNGTITIAARKSGNFISVTVQDNGSGIPAAQLENIFDRFSTSKKKRPDKKSTGLGLYISKRIIEAHNGTISLSSEEGKGTSITFQLRIKR